MKKYYFLFAIIFFFCSISFSENDQKKSEYNKTLGEPIRAYLNLNNISTIFKNTGISDIDIGESSPGFKYPRETGKTAVFESGLIWGANIHDPNELDPHVGGSTYREGLQGGWIDGTGNVIPPDDPRARIYRVRRDVFPGGPAVDLSVEAYDEGKSEPDIRAQYEIDWIEWPADLGAPYKDVDFNGTFDPNIDIPGVPEADQTIWYVANDQDPAKTQFLYGSMPMGIEMQATMWNYSQNGALNNVIFRSYKLINKSNVLGYPRTFDSMYVSMWSDPDIGASTNDFAGCDTTLQLGYAYNAEFYDPLYGYTPAGIGFNLLKSPNDLPMTAYYFFTRGDATVTDPIMGSHDGAVQFFNFMRGKVGLTGEYFINPITGLPTTYALSGDPLTGEGWIDGILHGPGDRRLGLSCGPFNMAPGDTQVVVVSEIASAGLDYLNTIRLLRFYSILSKDFFNNSFDMTKTPFPYKPISNASQQNENILLSWDNSSETFSQDGFEFQGYNIYQLASDLALKSNSVRIATFDKIDGITQIQGTVMNPITGYPEPGIEQFGSDSGLEYSLIISEDAIDSTYLIPGKPYYFAVTSYAYNSDPNALPDNTESMLNVLQVTLNIDSVVNYGSYFEVVHTQGDGGGTVQAVAVDGYQVTGHNYKVTFDTLLSGEKVWNLKDETINTFVLSNQTDFSGSEITSPVTDGMQIRVKDANDVKRFSMTENGNGPVPEIFGFDITPPPAFNAYSADWYRDVAQSQNGGSLALPNGMQVAGGYFFCLANSTITTHESALGRWTRDGERFPQVDGNGYEIRFTTDGGYAWLRYTTASLIQVPFELWYLGETIDDPSDDVRYFPWINDDNYNDVFDFKLDHLASDGDNDPYSDWIYWMQPGPNPPPGEQAYNDLVALIMVDPQGWSGELEIEHFIRFVLMNYNQLQGSGGENEMPETGTVFRIEWDKSLAPGEDEFIIDQTVGVEDFDILPEKYVLEQNYPNPFNPSTTIKFALPERSNVNLSIYNILGQRIVQLVNDELESGVHEIQFNASSLASGVYFYTLSTGNYLSTKKMILLR
jgi:hypothetical protein